MVAGRGNAFFWRVIPPLTLIFLGLVALSGELPAQSLTQDDAISREISVSNLASSDPAIEAISREVSVYRLEPANSEGEAISREISVFNIPPPSAEIEAISREVSVLNLEGLADQPPVILTQPQSQSVSFGDSATFSLTAGGTAPLSYQWFFNATNAIPGATAPTLSVTNTGFTDAGFYSVAVSNSLGQATSSSALLTIMPSVRSARELQALGYTNDGVYRIDPDGPGGQSSFTAECLMSLSGGGWTKLTAGVANTILNTDTNRQREYLYVQSGTNFWFRSPTSRLVWDWASGKDLYGHYSYALGSNHGSFEVTPSNELQSFGVGGSSGGGCEPKCLIIYSTFLDPTNAQAQVCHDTQVPLSCGCGGPYTIYLREAPPACISLPTGSVAWWPGSGMEHDVVGGHQGMPTGSIQYSPGKVGSGFDFDGVGFDFIETAATPDLSPHAGTSGEMTLEAWVLVRSLPVNEVARVVHKVDASLGWEYQLMVDRSGQAHFAMSSANGASGLTATGGVLSPFIWHHLAGTYRYGQFIRLYVDGQLVSEIQNPALVTAATPAPLVIGGSPYFNGMLDEIALYNRALTSNEIAAIYAAGSAGMCTSSPPVIVTQPLSQTVAAGTDVTLSVVASGLPGPSYQWFYNDGLIGGANGSSLSLVDVDAARSGAYRVVVSNAFGVATSSVATLTAHEAPLITRQPQAQTVLMGQSASFMVDASGTLPLGFFWYRNGLPFTNQVLNTHSSTISLPYVQTFDSANFQVVVTNVASPAGVSSAMATLTVLAPVGIVAQPTNTTATLGGSATFCVSATGSAPIRYQWRHNGASIPGATSACLSITNVSLADGGTYQVAIENAADTLVSDSALLAFAVPDSPAGDNFVARINLGTNASGSTLRGTNTFATKEAGEPDHAGKPGGVSVWYRWISPSNGVATFRTVGSAFDTLLAVYTGASVGALTPVASDEDDGGFFTSALQFNAKTGTNYAIALDGFGGAQGAFVLSWNLEVTPDTLPVITAQPASRTVSLGASTTLSVSATGSGLKYQWHLNGAALLDKTNSTLTIPSVQATNVGNYLVAVTNSTSRGLRSEVAVLEIGPVSTVQSQDKFADLFLNVAGGGGGGLGPASSGGFISVSIGTTTSPQILNNTGASTQSGEADHCIVISTATRWLRYRAENAGVMVIDTAGSAIPTVLEVYADVGVFGFPVNSLACGKTNAPDGRNSRVSFATVAGKEYYVAADGFRGAVGIIQMNATLGQSPILPATVPTNTIIAADENFLLGAPAPLNTSTQLRYQWQLNGRDILNATNATYLVNSADATDGGTYTVVVINEFGAVTKTMAVLGVNTPYLRGDPQLLNGQLRLWVQRPAGQAVVVEGTGDLGAWTPLQTVPLTVLGPIIDLPATNTLRFFRARPWP